MKKIKRILSILLIAQIILIVLFTSAPVYGVTINKDIIATNLNKYLNGEKTAKTTLSDGSSVSFGNDDPDDNSANLTITDDTLTVSFENQYSIPIKYNITNNICTFSVTREIRQNMDSNDFALELQCPYVLMGCFIAITDAYNIDNSKSLNYVESKVDEYYGTMDENENDLIGTVKQRYNEHNFHENDLFTYNMTSANETANKIDITATLGIKLNNLDQFETAYAGKPIIKKDTGDNTTNNDDNPIIINGSTVNTVVNKDGKDDTTVTDKTLPQTGATLAFGAVAVFFIIRLAILSIKNKNYKDIK